MHNDFTFWRKVGAFAGLSAVCGLGVLMLAGGWREQPAEAMAVQGTAPAGRESQAASVAAVPDLNPVAAAADGGLWKRMGSYEVLATGLRPGADGRERRSQLLRTGGKYPLVVISGVVPPGDADAPDEFLTDVSAHVADHVMVKPRQGTSDRAFRQAVAAAGLRVGKRLGVDGPYLVHSRGAGIDTVAQAIAALDRSGAVEYAEPDYLVHASDMMDSSIDIQEVDGVVSFPEAALDTSTMPPPDCPVMDVESQQAATAERLLDLPAGSRIITFDKPAFMGGASNYNPYMQEQNIVLGSGTGVYIQGAYTSGYPDNGTLYMRPNSDYWTIKHRENLPFTMLGIDISEYSTVFASPRTVTFTGYKVGGGTVSQTFTTDGVIDGTGPSVDFQNFTFNSSFTNLYQVVASTKSLMVDNIAVLVEGQESTPPEPPLPPLVYDITWDGPLHQVDQPTAVGGPYAPTSINNGMPMVRSQIGSMVGPALEFNGSGYQQVRIGMSNNAEAYRLEFDLYMDLPTAFVVHFDGAGGVQRFDFMSNGSISLYQSGPQLSLAAGSYPLRQVVRIAVDVDMLEPAWELFVDGVSQYRGPFDISQGDLRDIRFHESGNSTGRAGVDNVQIHAYGAGTTQPEGPRIATHPASLAFPAMSVGATRTWHVKIQNQGSSTLEVGSITSTSSHFRMTGSSTASVMPGGTFYVPVEFAPQSNGLLTGALEIESNDPDQPLVTVPLSGTGLGAPQISLDPSSLKVTMLADTTGSRQFTISNTGGATLDWSLVLKGVGSPGQPPEVPPTTPDDTQFGSMWSMREAQPGIGGIDAVHAWSLVEDNGLSVVAVIDTGVDLTHPELQGSLWTNPGEIPDNGVDDDSNGFIDDVHGWDFVSNDNNPSDGYGHGTHVSGTIAAQGNNALGVAGVCWNARIMALKFLSDQGSGYTSDAVAAVNYARQMGARITNNSWGGGGYSQSLYGAIQAAGQAGSLFVAAAGNSDKDTDASPNYPSCYDLDCVVSVASTDQFDSLSYFSNHGKVSVDLAAPGSGILSLRPGGMYGMSSGTSMATPHVSGVAALLSGRNPLLTPAMVKQLLMFGSDSLATLGGRVACNGRLNAYRALNATIPQWIVPQITSGSIAVGASQVLPLALDTASLTPGIYNQTVAVSSNDPGQPVVELPVELKVLPVNAYHAWHFSHFATDQMLQNVMEESLWGELADPDGDRLSNLLEFITGGDPEQADPQNVPTMVRVDGQDLFEFRVKQSLVDVGYRIEWTADLNASEWQTDGLTIVDESTEGMPAGIHRVRVHLPDTTEPDVFFRLVGLGMASP